jgi:hypothetical protein
MSGKVVNTKHVAHKEDALASGEMTLRDGMVYIGRFQFWGPRRYFRRSPFANDFGVNRYGREESLRRYEEKLRSNPELMAKLPELRGKTLACWCAGEEGTPKELTLEDPPFCHGQVLLRMIEEVT